MCRVLDPTNSPDRETQGWCQQDKTLYTVLEVSKSKQQDHKNKHWLYKKWLGKRHWQWIFLKNCECKLISRPRVARAGTNKLKCQKNLPTGSHLTQISAGVPNLDETLNLNNFGQNGQNWKIFVAIIKPARWGFRGKKSFFDFNSFWPCSWQNCEPTLKSASKYGTFAPFFGTPNFTR